jgi:hypothetical protein
MSRLLSSPLPQNPFKSRFHSSRIVGRPTPLSAMDVLMQSFELICLTMVVARSICCAVRGRTSVETKTGSRSFVTEIIVSALGAKNSIFVTRFVGAVKSCLCQLLLLLGAIAKAKATAGTVPCSKMWSIQRLIIVHFALSVTSPFEFENGFCFLCT